MKRHKFADEDIICMANGSLKSKINSPTSESKLLRNTRPSVFHSKETMLKIDKIQWVRSTSAKSKG